MVAPQVTKELAGLLQSGHDDPEYRVVQAFDERIETGAEILASGVIEEMSGSPGNEQAVSIVEPISRPSISTRRLRRFGGNLPVPTMVPAREMAP